MSSTSLRFDLPVGNRPRILFFGLADHGTERVPPPRRERHCHRAGVWALHVHQYDAVLHLCKTTQLLHPGTLSIVAPEMEMNFEFQAPCQHFFVLFSLEGPASQSETVAALRDLGGEYDLYNERLAAIVDYAALQPARADALLWTLLWDLCARPSRESLAPGAVARARQLIEGRLGEQLSVANLAAELGLSHNHLTRRFRAELGMTVSAYIVERRLNRARQLLLHTTRPVKSIAAEVGMGDLQAFNKCLRRVTGASPRQIRREG